MDNKKRVVLDSLGCKLNQAETELLAREFTKAGYHVLPPGNEAEVYILNTCTVTHIADRKSRHWLRLAHRQNPNAVLVATGCYAERAPEALAQLKGVNLVLGNRDKPRLLELVNNYTLNPHTGNAASAPVNSFRTRALVKVQDGCSNYCAYCIVPLVRGWEQSLPPEQVITEVTLRVAEGYQEVVLTGVKIGSYQYEGSRLKTLLERILADTEVSRLRLSSLQPQEISAELIELWSNPRLCRHFHLSLQSGSNTVLSRMKRRYSTGDYQQTVSLIRSVVPQAAITTDVIVGFPGETEREFEESHDFCRRMEFARIHVFPYSPRPETEAARMPQPVADKVKKQRTQKMLALAGESALSFNQSCLGQVIPVLWEQQTDGTWSGLTDNYLKVYAESAKDLANRLETAKLTAVRADGVWGEIT